MTFPNTLVFLCIIVGRKMTSHLVSAYPCHLLKKKGTLRFGWHLDLKLTGVWDTTFPPNARTGTLLFKHG